MANKILKQILFNTGIRWLETSKHDNFGGGECTLNESVYLENDKKVMAHKYIFLLKNCSVGNCVDKIEFLEGLGCEVDVSQVNKFTVVVGERLVTKDADIEFLDWWKNYYVP